MSACGACRTQAAAPWALGRGRPGTADGPTRPRCPLPVPGPERQVRGGQGRGCRPPSRSPEEARRFHPEKSAQAAVASGLPPSQCSCLVWALARGQEQRAEWTCPAFLRQEGGWAIAPLASCPATALVSPPCIGGDTSGDRIRAAAGPAVALQVTPSFSQWGHAASEAWSWVLARLRDLEGVSASRAVAPRAGKSSRPGCEERGASVVLLEGGRVERSLCLPRCSLPEWPVSLVSWRSAWVAPGAPGHVPPVSRGAWLAFPGRVCLRPGRRSPGSFLLRWGTRRPRVPPARGENDPGWMPCRPPSHGEVAL